MFGGGVLGYSQVLRGLFALFWGPFGALVETYDVLVIAFTSQTRLIGLAYGTRSRVVEYRWSMGRHIFTIYIYN